MARGAVGAATRGGVDAGRQYDQREGVNVKVQVTMASTRLSTRTCVCMRCTCDMCISACVCLLCVLKVHGMLIITCATWCSSTSFVW